jgi:phosphoribosylformylglycinamidine (FGAM) synthase-like enzyme
MAFTAAGMRIGVVGGLGEGHIGGSEYLKVTHGKIAGMPPPLDLAREKAVQKAVRELIRAGIVKTAHDCSDGGLAVALAEMCFGNDVGARVDLKSKVRADHLLFGEDASRIVIAYSPDNAARVEQTCGSLLVDIGQTGGSALVFEGLFTASVAALREAWSRAIPNIVGA